MLRTHEAVVDILQADAAIGALFPGGVWNRELKQTGPGHTAAAWAPVDPADPSSPKVLRPSIVVTDEGEYGSGFIIGNSARVLLFAYAPANDAGRATLAEFDDRLRQALGQAHLAIASGDGAPRWGEFRVGFRSPILDEPAYGGTFFCSWSLTFVTALLDRAAR